MLKKTIRLGLIELLIGLQLTACARVAPRSVSGTEDEQLDRLSAQLEETRSKALVRQLSCTDRCALAEDGCRISNEICAIARRQPSRRDLGQTCAGSQEQCVDLRERCLRCR